MINFYVFLAGIYMESSAEFKNNCHVRYHGTSDAELAIPIVLEYSYSHNW